MRDPLKPSAQLLCKLGSIAVHAEELTSPNGHMFDHVALTTILLDKEVQGWLYNMGKLAMIPVKR